MELISAKNRIELAVAQLKRLIGVPPEKIRQYQFLPVSLPEQKVVVREVTLVPPVIEDTYAYKSSKIQRQINEKNVLFSRRNYWPQLNFSAGVTYGHLNYLKPTEPLRDREGLNWHVLLTLDFNFLDWGIRKRNLVIADYEREIQDNALDQSLLDVQSEIEQLKTNLSRSAESYQVGFELLKLENESYQRIEIDFQAGRAAYLDLVTSISGVLEAKNQFISSYFDLMQNRAQYYYLKGSIYENWPQF